MLPDFEIRFFPENFFCAIASAFEGGIMTGKGEMRRGRLLGSVWL